MKIALNSTAFIIFLFAFFRNNVNGQTIFGTGGQTISNEAYNSIPVASTPGMGNNPSSADLSNWFPIAGNQGTQGSCVAWACCALKAYYEAKEVGSSASSLNLAFSPSFIYNQIKISTCEKGSFLEKALTFLETDGVCELKDFPYNPNNCSNFPSGTIKSQALNFRNAGHNRVDFKNLNLLKAQLVAENPIIFLMDVDNAIQYFTGDGLYLANGIYGGVHCMVIAGYDDNKSAFKVFNSYGSSWGNNGYCWIPYTTLINKTLEAYTVQDLKTSQPIKTSPTVTQNNSTNDNVTVNIQAPTISQGIPLNIPGLGIYPGISVTVNGNINNGQGLNGQLVIRFFDFYGNPLIANPLEVQYHDINGIVASGSPILPIINNPGNTAAVTMTIPYYAFNFFNSGNLYLHTVNAVAYFYLNNYLVATSSPSTFSFYY